jgi:hypothetical protein
MSYNSCSNNSEKKSEEEISVEAPASGTEAADSANSVFGNMTMKQISTFPNRIILTGLKEHRFLSVYKTRNPKAALDHSSSSGFYYDNEETEDESTQHFMPGIDILFGYNLFNISHYDLKNDKRNYLFNHPVLIKTFYYPSYVQDSLDKKPINRNFYLVSVYDEDTNKDTLINRHDLRRFYVFDSTTSSRTLLVPSDYSVLRSQYESQNDIMYVFARHDLNKNGTQDIGEPVNVFWFSLKAPAPAKMLY